MAKTWYFYTKRQPQGKYEVIKASGSNLRVASEKVDSYAREKKIPLAGGLFYAQGKPWDFKEKFVVIELPKGYKRREIQMKTINSSNVVDYIMEYEGGNMTTEDMLKFFGYLIKTGQAWRLQGMYGRQASALIEQGLINKKGEVQWKEVERRGINKKAMIYEE